MGFEDAVRPPINPRRARLTPAVLAAPGHAGAAAAYARLARIIRKTPEVMVKVTGRTRDAGHLQRHLDYISRNGRLDLEGSEGERHVGRAEVRDLAAAWAAEIALDPRRRRDSPVSLSLVLSMPAGTDPHRLQDAARAFARGTFGERFPYVFVLHDEGRHPHVHLTVRMLGREGERLNPRKADLETWRQAFARALRDRGVEAEASPRRARGVARKAERTPVRKIRDRFLAGDGPAPRVWIEAARAAKRGDGRLRPWAGPIAARDARIRRLLAAEAIALARSERPEDRILGQALAAMLHERPRPETVAERMVRNDPSQNMQAGRPPRAR